MDSEVSLMLNRANNELNAARALKKLSEEEELKALLEVPVNSTFYSSVISHAYYAMFYGAKAYLLSKGEKFVKQGQHQQVYIKFRKFVKEGVIDKELLLVYEDVKIKAEELLEVLDSEREKRKNFTYETSSEANREPAEKSLENAAFFISHIIKFIKK